MQKILLSSAMIVAMAAPSFAGGYEEPVIEPAPFVVEEPVGSLGGYGAAAALLGGAALIAILASDDDDDDDDSDGTN
ncbi:hypothetical protein [Tropicimonas isoalkanivorans]|uniref:Uncharacterized protein n=1 Tax=Tropicimonas isoalkanivorans TaxID=441112 RepID=A0A1I1L3S0_9RHOB|nr:hypothetical protein [Tropicimonas isoalkanivorans]SFC65638.1 hypothetical protein SAMN04488094_107129 [Tropicimonas isoalkanivorans]